jgi:hypothetical protein
MRALGLLIAAVALAAAVVGVGAGAAGCASVEKRSFTLLPKQDCHSDELSGWTTLAATADTAPYGADPLKSFTCGAPPR